MVAEVFMPLGTHTPSRRSRRMGIEVRFVTGENPDDFAKQIDDKTRAICELLSLLNIV